MKAKQSKCKTPFCKGKRRNRNKYCPKCIMRRWRQNNPMKAAYFTLRDNAKRRKKIFTLTFEQFIKFAVQYEYIQRKGKTAISFSIDCKIPELGYTESNIQPMQLADNARKGKKQLFYDWKTKTAYVYKTNCEKLSINTLDEIPF